MAKAAQITPDDLDTFGYPIQPLRQSTQVEYRNRVSTPLQ
jgi:hypothetical protein